MVAPALVHRQPQRVTLGEEAEGLGDLPRQPSILQVCTPSLAVAEPSVATLAFPLGCRKLVTTQKCKDSPCLLARRG